MIAMTEEEVLLHVKKIVDYWDKRFAEEVLAAEDFERRHPVVARSGANSHSWMWKECIDEIRPFLKEIK